METCTATFMDYDEFDRLVHKHCGDEKFEIIAEAELNNYQSKTMDISPNKLGTQDCNIWNQYADHLCFLGVLPEGKLVIDIFW